MATDVRGHTVPAGSDAFDPQGAIVATSLSINDVVYASNASDRTAKVAAIAPTTSDPVLILQLDTGVIWKHDGTTAVQMAAPLDDTGWTTATLGSSWVSYDSGASFAVPRYRRMSGIERLDGAMKSGTSGTTIFTLPAGHRPAFTLDFLCAANAGIAHVRITSAGVVSVTEYFAGGTNAIVNLSGVQFVAEA